MDFFGIGAAVQGAARIYFRSACRSGRTTYLINSLKPGDRVIFKNHQEMNRVRNLCKERGVQEISFVVTPPKDPSRIFNRGTPQGRVIFDHSWLEDYYNLQLENIDQDITHLEREASGWNEAHEETRLAAKEILKWRGF